MKSRTSYFDARRIPTAPETHNKYLPTLKTLKERFDVVPKGEVIKAGDVLVSNVGIEWAYGLVGDSIKTNLYTVYRYRSPGIVITGYEVFSAVAASIEFKMETHPEISHFCCHEVGYFLNEFAKNNSVEEFPKFIESNLIGLIFKYFLPEYQFRDSVIWGGFRDPDAGELTSKKNEARIVGMTILAEICKDENIKFCISKR